MSAEATAWAWQQICQQPADKLVLLWLANRADPEGNVLLRPTDVEAALPATGLEDIEEVYFYVGALELKGYAQSKKDEAGQLRLSVPSPSPSPLTLPPTPPPPSCEIDNTGPHGSTFENAWATYPKRLGGNSRAGALKAWNARLRQGYPAVEMFGGLLRYRAFIQATDRDGTEYVMQASTFFGPGERFLEAWQTPGDGSLRVGRPNNTPPAPYGDDEPWMQSVKGPGRE